MVWGGNSSCTGKTLLCSIFLRITLLVRLTNIVTETVFFQKAIDHCIYIYKSYKQMGIFPLLGGQMVRN